jgi:hypothetical protein
MGWILGFGIPVAYWAVWTACARVLFQRYRIHEVEKANCPNRKRKNDYYGYDHGRECMDCRVVNAFWWQGDNRDTATPYNTSELVFLACLHAFAWPVVGPVSAVWYVMARAVTANPSLAPSEIKAREKAQAERIRELEELNRQLSDATQ